MHQTQASGTKDCEQMLQMWGTVFKQSVWWQTLLSNSGNSVQIKYDRKVAHIYLQESYAKFNLLPYYLYSISTPLPIKQQRQPSNYSSIIHKQQEFLSWTWNCEAIYIVHQCTWQDLPPQTPHEWGVEL